MVREPNSSAPQAISRWSGSQSGVPAPTTDANALPASIVTVWHRNGAVNLQQADDRNRSGPRQDGMQPANLVERRGLIAQVDQAQIAPAFEQDAAEQHEPSKSAG